MAAQERIRDEPDTVDIEDDRGVTQPRHGGVHAEILPPVAWHGLSVLAAEAHRVLR